MKDGRMCLIKRDKDTKRRYNNVFAVSMLVPPKLHEAFYKLHTDVTKETNYMNNQYGHNEPTHISDHCFITKSQ
jgi:hypothetical protein